jgi:hypothetical protein
MQVLQKQLPEQQILLTMGEVIFRLNNQCLERKHAFSAYAKKYTCFANQMAAIDDIAILLLNATKATEEREAINLIIRTQALFLFIAPRQTFKLYNTYYSKLHELFLFCHNLKERLVKAA